MMNSEKLTGFLLLFLGLMMMIGAGINVYLVFTGVFRPFALFNFPGLSFDIGSLLKGSLPANVEQFAQMGSVNQEIISKDMINVPLNFTAHLFLMGFIAQIGFRVASLGVQLLRTIEVKLKDKLI